MSWKDIFIVNENKTNEEKNTEPVKKENKYKFPSSTEAQTPNVTTNFGNSDVTQTSNEYIVKAVETYEKGFESLNQDGYDFFEFYKTVIQGGVDNPQVYNMCFTMGSAMDKTITKEKLLSQSDFYVSEITKVYNDNVNKGNIKKQNLISERNSENQSLVSELNMLNQQLEALKIQIQDRESKLSTIGGKYEPKLNEIENKLSANDIAKNKLVQSIDKVRQGIINNLK